MRAVHDRGGWPETRPIDRADHQLEDWERLTDAMMQLLSSPEKRIIRLDEMRRTIESLPPEQYESLSYYERWASALESLMIEKKILTREQIELKVAELEQRERGGA